MHCEMCGAETSLFKALIEGTELKVCSNCAKFGKIKGKVRQPETSKKAKKEIKEEEEPEVIETIVPGYSGRVKKARESAGLKQEELAKKLNEKESIIHKIETGHYEPDIALAKKLERFFKIALVEEQKVEKQEKQKTAFSAEGFTIGDIIKLRKK